jgi:hypothetical protein
MLKIAALLMLTTAAHAENRFIVTLGGQPLGTLIQSETRLSSRLTNTPLGVFNGTFDGESRSNSSGTTYRGVSQSTRKTRQIEIRQAHDGRIIETTVIPEKDRTPLSTPTAVPTDTLNPVAGFHRLLGQNACPQDFKIYDGRRVIQVTPTGTESNGPQTICTFDYKVVQGRGHLSPLYIKNITLKLTFDPSKYRSGPSLLTLRSGLFAVEFRRD